MELDLFILYFLLFIGLSKFVFLRLKSIQKTNLSDTFSAIVFVHLLTGQDSSLVILPCNHGILVFQLDQKPSYEKTATYFGMNEHGMIVVFTY